MRILWQVEESFVPFSFYASSSNPSALSVLRLSVMWTSGIDVLLFYSMKSSIPVTDLISFRKGIVAKDIYV